MDRSVRVFVFLLFAAAAALLAGGWAAVSTGHDVYSLGKLDTAEVANIRAVIAAARDAADELGLLPDPKSKDKYDGCSAKVSFVDDKGAWLCVRVDRRTATLALIQIDVGFFGSQSTARLFLARMRRHLPGAEPRGQVDESETTNSDMLFRGLGFGVW